MHFTKGQVPQYNVMRCIQPHQQQKGLATALLFSLQVSHYWRPYKMRHLLHLCLASVGLLTYRLEFYTVSSHT